MNRRDFIGQTLLAGLATELGVKRLRAATPEPRTAPFDLTRYRFGVNYTPTRRWWFCWNDFSDDDIARDLDAIAELGADHIRIMCVWTYFQPNPAWVSPAHLDRLDRLLALAAQRRLDVCVSMLVGHLTGQNFRQGYQGGLSLYTDPGMLKTVRLYFERVAEVCRRRPNFLGFDLGNEMDCCWATNDLAAGDRWCESMLGLADRLAPEGVHVNGVDAGPWFHPASFSPRVLARRQRIVALHAWTKYTGALARGGPLDPPSLNVAASLAALARSYAGDPHKPVWVQEYGASEAWMTPAQADTFCERATVRAADAGVAWFTWWASHDIDRKFEVDELEYSLGLIGTNNRLKRRGEIFRDVARTYRGRPVRFAPSYAGTIAPPPAEYNDAAAWAWMDRWRSAFFGA